MEVSDSLATLYTSPSADPLNAYSSPSQETGTDFKNDGFSTFPPAPSDSLLSSSRLSSLEFLSTLTTNDDLLRQKTQGSSLVSVSSLSEPLTQKEVVDLDKRVDLDSKNGSKISRASQERSSFASSLGPVSDKAKIQLLESQIESLQTLMDTQEAFLMGARAGARHGLHGEEVCPNASLVQLWRKRAYASILKQEIHTRELNERQKEVWRRNVELEKKLEAMEERVLKKDMEIEDLGMKLKKSQDEKCSLEFTLGQRLEQSNQR